MSLVEALQKVIGSNHVSTDALTRARYSYDASECSSVKPSVVVYPSSVRDVSRIVRVANKQRVPLTPVVACTNGWGQHIPLRRGIVMDLSRMNKILEINEEMRYMVVEPGVDVRTVQRRLARRGFYASIPKACPAQASMLVNLIIQGTGAFPLKFGPQSDMVNGLEAVLANGEVVRCGSCGCGPYWFARSPLPDLVGLFSGWYGSTGVVTKIGFPIYKKPLHTDLVCMGIEKLFDADFGGFVSSLADLEVADDIACYTRGVKFVGDGVKSSSSDIPLYLYAMVSGSSRTLVKAKVKELIASSEKTSVGGRPVRIMDVSKEDRREYLDLPSLIDFNVERFGGSTNPCSYIPISKWSIAMSRVQKVCWSFGWTPEFRLEVFRGSRYGSLMTYLKFDKGDRDDLRTVRQLVHRIVEIYVNNGGLVWKAPPWAWNLQIRKSSHGFSKLLTKVKQTMDPNGIMNPGRLGSRSQT
ncbi:MAG: FAD-binding oxidoreductase [Thaumarchaeota archaeon]|nr:FAD-binding oxidoreductase [Nitrososphaerota archaeon]